MKQPKYLSNRSMLAIAKPALLLSLLTLPMVHAATYYWDNDGATAGFGTAAGTWAAPTIGDATQGWSEDSAGTTEPVGVTTNTSDTVNFGTSSVGLGAGTVTVSGTVDVNKATFGSASGAITLSGGIVALGGTSPSITLNSTGHTISSALTLDANTSVVMGTPATLLLNLNGSMGGTGNLTFTTPNTGFNNADQRINLGAASSYTGNTLLNVGNAANRLQVTLGVEDALPATTVLTFDGGIGSGSGRNLYLDLNGFDQTLAGLTNIVRTARTQRVFSNGGPSTLTVNNADDYSFGGSTTFVFNGTKTTRTQITSDVSLVKTGAGTFTLIEIHPYTGTTLVSGGRLQGVVGGNIANSAVTLEASGIYGVSVTDNTKSWTCASLTTSGAGTLEFDFGSVAPSTTVSPMIITGTSGVADFAAATPTVSVVTDSALPPGTYPLMTWDSISGSAPTAANLTMSNLPAWLAADLQVSGTTLNLVITTTSSTIVKADNAVDLNLGSSWEGGTAPVPYDIAKWNNIVTSANTTVLGADSNWAGLVIENPTGPVTIGGANTLTLGLGPAATEIDLSAATADLTLNCAVALGDANIWNVATGRTLTVGGGVTGDFLLTMQGNGTVRLGADDVLPNGTGNGNVVVDATLDLNGNSETVNGLSGAGAIDNSSDSTIATLTAGDNDQSGTFTGILQDSGASATLNFEKTGTGSIRLGSANTMSGSVTITGGILAFTNTNPFDNASGIVMDDGTRLEPRVDGGTIIAPINLNGGVGTITFPAIGSTGGAVFTLNLDSQISGTGGLTLFGVQGSNTYGTIVLGAANTYQGDTLIDAVIFSEAIPLNNTNTFVELGIENALPTTTVLTIDGRIGDGSGRTSQVDLKGFNQTLAGLTNIPRTGRRQRIVNSSATAATLTVSNTADFTFSGNLGVGSNTNFGLTKSGTGTFTLSSSSTYSGTTAVNEGTLGLNGASLTSAVTVAGGAAMEFTLGAPASTTGSLDLGTGTVKIIGTVDNASDYQLITATGGITGSLTLDVSIPGYQLELRNGDTELWLAYVGTGGYSAWALLNGAGPNLNDDHDGDGVSNGVEYFIGGPNGNTTGFTTLPGVANDAGTLSVTFTKAADYVGVYGTDYEVQVSSTLASWSPAPGGTVTFPSATEVKYTFPAGTKNFARLKVTGP